MDYRGRFQIQEVHKALYSNYEDLETHITAIQSLVRDDGQGQNLQKEGSQRCENKEALYYGCSPGEEPSSNLAISRHADVIRTMIKSGKQMLQSCQLPSPLPQSVLIQLKTDHVSMETESRDKALSNSVVLRTIMSHMNVQDLLGARLVAKHWEDEATIQLLSPHRERERTKVTFEWDSLLLKFKNKVGTLQEFTESYYDNPLRKFPCSQFSFSNIFLDSSHAHESTLPADLFNFMSNHGHHIKSLSLEFNSNSAAVIDAIRKIISEYAPGVKSLSLQFVRNMFRPHNKLGSESDNDGQLSPLNLPNLQQLHFTKSNRWYLGKDSILQRYKDLVKEILSSAPNLNLISDPYLFLIPEIIASGQIRALHHVDLYGYPSTTNNFVFFEFSRADPKMTHFEFCPKELMLSSNFSQGLQRILQSSRSTLKTINLYGSLDPDVENFRMDIPVMENMRQLALDWLPVGDRQRILPHGFNLQNSFPRLKALSFTNISNKELEGEVDNRGNPFSDGCNASTTVEKLCIEAECDSIVHPGWLPQTITLYPNVRLLEIKINSLFQELPRICYSLWMSWHSSVLEELHITVDLMAEFDDDLVEEMDVVLTGLDYETCDRLRSQCGIDVGPLERKYCSIFNMQRLKLLKLTDETSDGGPLFSPVSIIYALEPMRQRQNLRVELNGLKLEELIQAHNMDFWGAVNENRPVDDFFS